MTKPKIDEEYNSPIRSALHGETIEASYVQSSEYSLYSLNPFVEALGVVASNQEIADRVARRPLFCEEERNLPVELRQEATQKVAHFVEPMPALIDLAQRFSRMIRSGYFPRNPISPEWIDKMNKGFPGFGKSIREQMKPLRSKSGGFAIIGMSGVGKSTAIESILLLYPQIIIHTEYLKQSFHRTQLVWLKLDCPHDGSVRGLCVNFFQVIDELLLTRYYPQYINNKRKSKDELLPIMASIAARVGLGVLVVDEIQRLREAKRDQDTEMLNFFVQLSNVIGVPVVLIGTYKAMGLLNRDFAMARRSSGQGDFVWDRMKKDEEWDYFLEKLWKYQWTSHPIKLTDELRDAMYDASQGIIDIAVKLYQQVQINVIGSGDENITPDIIHEVFRDNFYFLNPLVRALKDEDRKFLSEIPDMVIPPKAFISSDYSDRTSFSSEKVCTAKKVVDDMLDHETNRQKEQLLRVLLAAGIGEDIATSCVGEEFADKCNFDRDFADIVQRSLHRAKDRTSLKSALRRVSRKKSAKKADLEAEDLRTIVNKTATGISAYDALLLAGVIKKTDEFF